MKDIIATIVIALKKTLLSLAGASKAMIFPIPSPK